MRKTYKLVLAALFMSIGLVLPFLTGQIPQVGNLLLPMHLPVFLCGFICGWQYGAAVGLIVPLLRSCIFGMPVLFPNAVAMAAELAVYGLVAGFLYKRMNKKNLVAVYGALLPAMLLGRGAWGVIQVILLGFTSNTFTWQMFMAGAFLNAIPGIILQLVLIPSIMSMIHLAERSGKREKCMIDGQSNAEEIRTSME